MRFSDRVQAGRQLADLLKKQGIAKDTVVLGLPRGGVPVAYEVAVALDLPLDVIIVRKLGVPFQRELAMGAIGEDEVRVLNDEVVRGAGVGPEDIATVEKLERAELERRVELFRGDRPRIPLTGRTALIIDDGIAAGVVRATIDSHFLAQSIIGVCNGLGEIIVRDPEADVFALARKCTDLLLHGMVPGHVKGE